MTKNVLTKVTQNTKQSFNYDQYIFNSFSEGNMTFMALIEEGINNYK